MTEQTIAQPDGPTVAPGGVPTTERARLRERVEQALANFLRRQRDTLSVIDPALVPVCDAIDDFVLRGGKRLRPAFGYWAFRGAGGTDTDEIMTALAALEFVQASALIHDDVMDDSDTRRGEPATHRRFANLHGDGGWTGDPAAFGQASAILLGDLCLVWSDEMLQGSQVAPSAIARARLVFDDMRTEVIVGQYLDVLTQATGETSIERAAKVARYKSAKYTVERPMLLGAALADATAPVQAACSGYGLPLGEAFQLRDDVLGVFGDPARTGKPAGDDLREGKRTYLVATAFELADPAQRAALEAGLGAAELDSAGIDRLRAIIEHTGALARTEARIVELTGEALAALNTATLEPEAVRALTELAHAATQRLH